MPRHQALIFSWSRFAEIVKYESRYLFVSQAPDENLEPHEVGPGDMLAAIGEVVSEAAGARVIRELAAGTEISRARAGSAQDFIPNAAELGTAPRDKGLLESHEPGWHPALLRRARLRDGST
jgi:hypothetical protein